MAKPFGAATFFAQLPTVATMGATAAVVAVAVGSALLMKDGRGLHDRIAGTRVVKAPAWRLATVQWFGEPRKTPDPLMTLRLRGSALSGRGLGGRN